MFSASSMPLRSLPWGAELQLRTAYAPFAHSHTLTNSLACLQGSSTCTQLLQSWLAALQSCQQVTEIHKAGFFPACAKAELLSGKRLSFRVARLTSLQTSRKDARLSPGLFADRGFATAFALAATLLPI